MRKTIISIGFIIFFGTATAVAGEDTAEQIRHLLEKETIQRADAALHEEPVTVTATRATRSAGGIHDFYSPRLSPAGSSLWSFKIITYSFQRRFIRLF